MSGTFHGDGHAPMSPFEDTFQFEDNSSNEDTHIAPTHFDDGATSNKYSRPQVSFNDETPKNKREDAEEFTFNDDTEYDNHSFQPTPKLNNGSGTFDDVELDNDSGEPHTNYDGMKRFRMGTKGIKGNPIMGRSKTLKWARKNIPNPFEDFTKDDIDPGAINRAQELRTVYYNMPLPKI